MRFYRALAVLAVTFSCHGAASAQIIVLHTVGDNTYTCVRTGLWSSHKDCGRRSDWYTYVFVGSITAISSVENDEKQLQIVPEEVFLGKPATSLTVLTSQAPCLPEMAIGDRWLFFLREKKNEPLVLDYYGNDSRPVADAQQEIETLRRLQGIGDDGIVRGEVRQGETLDWTAVPNARVIARRETDKIQFVSATDKDGRFEFPPMPSGKYTITVDPVGPVRLDDDEIEVSAGACWDLAISRAPHAQLAGRVLHADGSDVPNVAVVVMSADDSWFASSHTNERGYFTFDSLRPGEYVVGINLPGSPAWEYESGAGVPPPKASLYFGGTTERLNALVIKLAADEKRDDLDFIAPTR